jgi:archaetidylinositol phosphate synthase
MAELADLPVNPPAPRQWDARLARRLVAPLKGGPITPNHLTTLRLVVGLAAAAAFMRGGYAWSNLGALLLILSNFLDHADGELARISGKSSRFGHYYDLACDAAVTILAFVAMGAGDAAKSAAKVSPVVLGMVAGTAIALIFLLRMRIEALAGKPATRQAALGGFETEDILYLLPLVTLCAAINPFLFVASIGAPLFLVLVALDYRSVLSAPRTVGESASGPNLT